MREIKQASIEVLKVRKYRILAFAIALIMLALYVWLPVATIPRNDFQTQIADTSPIGFVVMILSSGAILFLAELQWYVVGITSALVLISLYIISKKVVNGCKSCEVGS